MTYDIFLPLNPLHKEIFVEILALSEVVVAADGEELPSLTSGSRWGDLARLGGAGPLTGSNHLEVFIAESSLVATRAARGDHRGRATPICFLEKKDPELEKAKGRSQEGRRNQSQYG